MQKTWLLVDSISTCTLICNKDLLTKIDTTIDCIKVKHIADYNIIIQQGYLAHHGDYVWYCPDKIAAILVLSELCK